MFKVSDTFIHIVELTLRSDYFADTSILNEKSSYGCTYSYIHHLQQKDVC